MSLLDWPRIRGCRFEKLALVALVVVLAIGEATAINHWVADLFGPIAKYL
jgi:hypothetical protein